MFPPKMRHFAGRHAVPHHERDRTLTTLRFETQHRRPFEPRTSRRASLGAVALAATGTLGAGLFPGTTLAQDASPAAGNEAGLGLWSEQLGTLSPDEITRLLLEQNVADVGYNQDLVAVETDYSSDPDFLFPDQPVHEVSLGIELDGNFSVGSGMFLIYPDAATAAGNLQAIAPGEADGTTTWAIPFAGLDGRWQVRGERTAIYLQAGPVVMVGTDEFLSDGALLHLMNSIANLLQNIRHVLFHLYGATNEALGIK